MIIPQQSEAKDLDPLCAGKRHGPPRPQYFVRARQQRAHPCRHVQGTIESELVFVLQNNWELILLIRPFASQNADEIAKLHGSKLEDWQIKAFRGMLEKFGNRQGRVGVRMGGMGGASDVAQFSVAGIMGCPAIQRHGHASISLWFLPVLPQL